MSPLPFGVLPAGYSINMVIKAYEERKSPLPFGALPAGYFSSVKTVTLRSSVVSIAFRRSARWLLGVG